MLTGNLLPSSHERRYLALKLVETLLPSLTVSEVEVVFSPGLIRCVINNMHKKDNLLSTAANHFVSHAQEPLFECYFILKQLEHLANEAVLLTDSGVVVEIIFQLLARYLYTSAVLLLVIVFCSGLLGLMLLQRQTPLES